MPSELESLRDAEIVARCRAGDARAWETLVARYQRLIFTIPRRAGLAQDAAADVFQAVFEQLHRSLDRIEQPDRLRAWLVTSARRESLRWLARERGESIETAAAEAASESPLPDRLIAELEEHHRVRRALANLDVRCQTLLGLLYGTEAAPAYAEIAERLGTREGSIGPWRARCLEKLRSALEGE